MNAPISSPTHQQTQSSTTWPQVSPAAAANNNNNNSSRPPKPATAKKATTDTFLKDFTLVAEAAQRAQVAVMIRDLENIGLS